jgi:adenosylmethionine-8-amino-7-oxononanoate aminotransferase
MSGLWVVAVGHGRTELAEVAREQMERLAFANPFVYATPPRWTSRRRSRR